MASGMTSSKRFAVRASLVSGSTIALIVGAQTLITVDVQDGRMTQDGASSSASNVAQPSAKIANAGISVIRQANTSDLQFSNNDSDQTAEELFNQQQQSQLNQQSQLFNSLKTFRRPRTHSSH